MRMHIFLKEILGYFLSCIFYLTFSFYAIILAPSLIPRIMKRKLLYFFCFTVFALSVAIIPKASIAQNKQPYVPMALEGAHWWVSFWDTNFPPWQPYDVYQYVLRGDTVVNDVTYKKVYYRGLTDEEPYLIEYEAFFGIGIRDDTANRKVYAVSFDNNTLYECPQNEEFLLYDFGVSIGDTINTCMVQDFGGAKIYSIEYEFMYGIERKIFIVEADEPFIEGIGSGYGVFEWGQSVKEKAGQERGAGTSLGNYCLGTDQECGCQWVGIEERGKSNIIKVSPVPAKESVNFEFGNIQNLQQAQLRCYDVFGSLLHSEALVQGQKEAAIDVSFWPPGIYVAFVYSNGGVVGKSKFVVE
jgi:hypothetical protein